MANRTAQLIAGPETRTNLIAARDTIGWCMSGGVLEVDHVTFVAMLKERKPIDIPYLIVRDFAPLSKIESSWLKILLTESSDPPYIILCTTDPVWNTEESRRFLIRNLWPDA